MISSRLGIEELRTNFKKIKKAVLKKFPGAKTTTDANGNYYIEDENGFRIIADLVLFPSQRSVYDAWYVVDHVSKIEKIVKSNSKRFSDDRIFKKIKE